MNITSNQLLKQLKHQFVQIRFVGTVGKRFESDIAIDDIALLPGPCTTKEAEKGKITLCLFLGPSKCGHVCRGIGSRPNLG